VRAIKSSVISILAIGLLVGSAVGVAAQDESRYSQGTWRVLNVTDWGERTDIEDADVLVELRDQTYEGVIESTDPRFEGPMSGTLNQDTHLMPPEWIQPAVTEWGTERIENDGGAWECTWSGGETQLATFYRMKWCVGEDGYEGHAARFLSTKQWGDPSIQWVALAWQGDLPPLPGPPAASTE